jgi:energy-converting hydrogenase B subunit Q
VGETQIELESVADGDGLVADLQALEVVTDVLRVPSFQAVFGKRVIVMGGGAQVGMVAQGAISEGDRHNIRGERISVDTIPLVGEERLATAVRAVARLHRARVLVLAGALMGGDITSAVREIQEAGIIVISTSMAGTVVDAADLVVSDPLEAGVMAVMLIADTAAFSIERVRGRRF